MLNHRTHIIGLLLIFSFTSCERDGPPQANTITGIVTERNTGSLVTSETVALIKEFDAGQHVDKLLAETTTDNNGQYIFNINEGTENLIKYHIRLTDQLRFFSLGSVDVGASEIIDQPKITKDISVIPAGQVAFRIRNLAPYDANDRIANIRIGMEGWVPYKPLDNVQLYGMSVDTATTVVVGCNEFNIITADVTKNNITTSFKDSIILTSFSSTVYNLDY